MLRFLTLNTGARRDFVPFRQPPPPPHPLFSLRSQTATSQLAGFRNILYRTFPHFYHWLHHIAPILFHGWNPRGPRGVPSLRLGRFEYFTNLNSVHLEMISLILPWFQGEQWGRCNLPSHWLQRPRAAAFALLVTEVHEFHHQTLVQREKNRDSL